MVDSPLTGHGSARDVFRVRKNQDRGRGWHRPLLQINSRIGVSETDREYPLLSDGPCPRCAPKVESAPPERRRAGCRCRMTQAVARPAYRCWPAGPPRSPLTLESAHGSSTHQRRLRPGRAGRGRRQRGCLGSPPWLAPGSAGRSCADATGCAGRSGDADIRHAPAPAAAADRPPSPMKVTISAGVLAVAWQRVNQAQRRRNPVRPQGL
jgi:hypothetical protein